MATATSFVRRMIVSSGARNEPARRGLDYGPARSINGADTHNFFPGHRIRTHRRGAGRGGAPQMGGPCCLCATASTAR